MSAFKHVSISDILKAEARCILLCRHVCCLFLLKIIVDNPRTWVLNDPKINDVIDRCIYCFVTQDVYRKSLRRTEIFLARCGTIANLDLNKLSCDVAIVKFLNKRSITIKMLLLIHVFLHFICLTLKTKSTVFLLVIVLFERG